MLRCACALMVGDIALSEYDRCKYPETRKSKEEKAQKTFFIENR